MRVDRVDSIDRRRASATSGGNNGAAVLPTRPANLPTRRAVALLALLALLTLGGCGEDEVPPAAGAQGPVLLRQWQQPGQEPIVLVARTVSHPRRDFRALDLSPVLMRMPFQDGTAFLAAPGATYAAAARGDASAGDLAGVRVRGPVHLSGTLTGEPFVGRAADLRFDSRTRVLELVGDAEHPVELCVRGAIQRAPRLRLTATGRDAPDGYLILPAPAAVAAALAALPERLVFPAILAD